MRAMTWAGTALAIVVRGLEPATTYAAHLHDAPCSAANPGGGHYKNDPAGGAPPPAARRSHAPISGDDRQEGD
jgi:hypothetical protein